MSSDSEDSRRLDGREGFKDWENDGLRENSYKTIGT